MPTRRPFCVLVSKGCSPLFTAHNLGRDGQYVLQQGRVHLAIGVSSGITEHCHLVVKVCSISCSRQDCIVVTRHATSQLNTRVHRVSMVM